MTEVENKTDNIGKVSETFFSSEIRETEKKLEKTEMAIKGSNRRFEEKWDIKFTMGSETFENIINFLNEIGFDVIMRFSKKDVKIYIMDISTTHAAHVIFDRTEFAEYVVQGVDENSEKVVYIDTGIVGQLMINKDYPVDFYVDTEKEKRFYVVCGKEIVSKRLNSMNDELNATIQGYKNSYPKLKSLLDMKEFQKIVVNQGALKNVLASLSKKSGGNKACTLVDVVLKKNEIDFKISDETKYSSILMSGEDALVYPLREDEVMLNLEYCKKFSKLKLSYQSNLYISSVLPFIFETKLGAGKVNIYFVVAPRSK